MKKCGNYNTCQCRGFRALELGRFWMFFHRFWWMFLCFNGCFHVAVHCFFMDFSLDFGVCPCFFHGIHPWFPNESEVQREFIGTHLWRSDLQRWCCRSQATGAHVTMAEVSSQWRIHGTSAEDLPIQWMVWFLMVYFFKVSIRTIHGSYGWDGSWIQVLVFC